MEEGKNNAKNDVQDPKQQKKKEYKKILVVNEDIDFEIFINNLDKIVDKKIPVAVDPSMNTEQLMANIRQENHFAQVKYDPNSMSHMIVQIMPEMTDMLSAYEDGMFEELDEFDESNTEDIEEMFEYPEDK